LEFYRSYLLEEAAKEVILDRNMNQKQDKEAIPETSFEVVVQGKQKKRAKRCIVIAKTCVVAAAVCAILSLVSLTFPGESFYFFFLASSVLFFAVGFAMGVKAYFIPAHRKPVTSYNRFVVYTVISLVLGVALSSYRYMVLVRFPILAGVLWFMGFFFTFVLTPGLGIIASLLSLRKKSMLGRLLAIASILILAIPIAICFPVVLEPTLPFIYTPPAITQESLKVYKACIKFVESHQDYGDLSLTGRWRPSVSFGGNSYSPRHHVRVKEAFSEAERMKMEELGGGLSRIRCHKFQRDNDMVLFYRMALYSLPFIPFDPLDSRSFLPIAPGVLYSLNGKNPNEINSEVLNAGKPFVRVAGNWYMSRHLSLRGMRLDTRYYVPKSLIDRSLRIDGVDPNDLCITEGG
jgi:hypothetical protein